MAAIRPALVALSIAVAAAAAESPAPAPAPKPYPLDTCIISGDQLGSMGPAVVIVRDGHEIKLCCKGCIKDFDKDAVGYLRKIEEAAKVKAGQAATPAACCPGAPQR